jgi:hypothetical protein
MFSILFLQACRFGRIMNWEDYGNLDSGDEAGFIFNIGRDTGSVWGLYGSPLGCRDV